MDFIYLWKYFICHLKKANIILSKFLLEIFDSNETVVDKESKFNFIFKFSSVASCAKRKKEMKTFCLPTNFTSDLSKTHPPVTKRRTFVFRRNGNEYSNSIQFLPFHCCDHHEGS